MGILLGKFRKKKSALEVLDAVDKEIKSIEEFRRDTEQTEKRIVARFVVISVGTYLLSAFIFYFRFFPANFYDQLFYIIPLIFAPVIIITVKRGLTWYYKRKISRKQNKLYTLREEKKKLLDEIKETETYKVAKTILDKYAPENQLPIRRSMGLAVNDNNKMVIKMETPLPPDTVLRQRALPPPQSLVSQTSSSFTTPYRPYVQPNTQAQLSTISKQPPMGVNEAPTMLPREILPKDPSVWDKMVYYLMGDGPSNRYALICKNCYGHNGMAHKDEFNYVSFTCCYCFTMNAARKKRFDAPKLEFDSKPPSSQTQSDTSESEKNSPSESECELEHPEEEKTIDGQIQPTELVQVEPEEDNLSSPIVLEKEVDDTTPIVKPPIGEEEF